jgi:hypothetical protein
MSLAVGYCSQPERFSACPLKQIHAAREVRDTERDDPGSGAMDRADLIAATRLP